MSRILAYTTPARGHLFPVTPILDELHRRGHEIALRTLASQVPLMRDRGVRCRADRAGGRANPDQRLPCPYLTRRREALGASVL
jgi:hypothetical protein